MWGAFFNATSTDPHKGSLQKRAVDSILAYMPSTPSFAYHGSAWGAGDFSNNGKWMVRGGWEREGGHYRAGLNSIPLAERFRAYPDELYLLEVAMGGMTGVLGNIDADGAPSMAFHLYPFMLEYDPYSGDHGLGFFGHAMNVGAYAVAHPALGWLCFLCALEPAAPAAAEAYTLTPLDSLKVRVYVAPLGLWLVLQTGTLRSVHIDPANRTLVAAVAPALTASKVRVQLSAPALATGRRSASGFAVMGAVKVRGALELPTVRGTDTMVTVRWVE